MKLVKRVTLLLGFILAISLVVVACGGGAPQARMFELEIREGSLIQEESILRMKQDDMVTIVVTADEPINFHLHGYDIERHAIPGEPATLEFTADATGSFPFTIHVVDEEREMKDGEMQEMEHAHEEEEIELGRLNVEPR